jgi:protein-S-isoprenylcysteine O-methyltransferase Ste14
MWQLHPLVFILVALGLVLTALAVFAMVGRDYRMKGHLSPTVSVLQVGYSCAYAVCSYVFLDSRISNIRTTGAQFPLSILLMGTGLAAVLFSMSALGRRSFGREAGKLNTAGLYRYSRNPQLVGGFLFILGYALLWPSWQGMLWASLWIPISALMVRGEEQHLGRVFGQEYHDYCAKTPRTIGLPKR